MGRRTAANVVVIATFVMWMGTRATAIALPLVALQQTGHTWATGLVLGAQAVPLATVGWWGRRLRERLTDGRAIAVVLVIEALGLAVVPVSAASGHLGVVSLAGCGLVVGAATALESPGLRALLSDLGDELGPGRAARYLAWQDFAHRAPMFLAPPIGAWAVGTGRTGTLLWAECAAFLAAATMVAAVPGVRRRSAPAAEAQPPRPPATAIRTVLRTYPRLAASIAVQGSITTTWFAFSLGLAVLGAQTGRPGVLIAAGMFGYGLASTVVASVAALLVNRIPAWPTAAAPAVVIGLSYVVLPHVTGSVVALAAVAAVGGATMPLGIAAHNRLLSTDPAPGPDRRAAFTADAIVDGCGSAIGMLGGGALLGVIGVRASFTASGVATMAVAVVAMLVVAVVGGGQGRRRPRDVTSIRTAIGTKRGADCA